MSWSWDNHDSGNHENGEYDFNSDIDMDLYSDFDVYSYIDVDHSIDVCVDISGNEATFAIDVQAFGEDSATDLNLVVLVNDGWSSITAIGYAATA